MAVFLGNQVGRFPMSDRRKEVIISSMVIILLLLAGIIFHYWSLMEEAGRFFWSGLAYGGCLGLIAALYSNFRFAPGLMGQKPRSKLMEAYHASLHGYFGNLLVAHAWLLFMAFVAGDAFSDKFMVKLVHYLAWDWCRAAYRK